MPFPGEKFKPSASREREITKLLETARGDVASFGVKSLDGLAPGHVIAKNETGADLAIGKAALIPTGSSGGVSSQEQIPRKDPSYQKGYYTLKALTPLISGANPYFESLAVTVEPIPSGKFGRVATAGLAIAAYPAKHGFITPASGDVSWGFFGLARVVTCMPATGSSDFSVWDLSCRAMQAVYTLTTNWASGSATATIAGASTQLLDTYGIASWQVNGDKGMAVYTGGNWVVITPWCVGS